MRKRAELVDKRVASKTLLTSMGVSVSNDGKEHKFVFSEELADTLVREYGFAIDQLTVGGDIPLPDLAMHIDRHSAYEARYTALAEIARYMLYQRELEFDLWYSNLYNKVHYFLSKSKSATEKKVDSYIKNKYADEYLKRRSEILDLEKSYRILNNVICAALHTKGKLLPTLRNIVQGDGPGTAEGIKATTEKSTRKVKV